MNMSKQAIPEAIRIWADEVIKIFNESNIGDHDRYYIARYKGRYLYLDRLDYENRHRIARLTYTGNLDGWEFAIFKYSDEQYDADEWLFPGSGYVDGTIVGAMKAGLEAYP
jgi:hypothetical protein